MPALNRAAIFPNSLLPSPRPREGIAAITSKDKQFISLRLPGSFLGHNAGHGAVTLNRQAKVPISDLGAVGPSVAVPSLQGGAFLAGR